MEVLPRDGIIGTNFLIGNTILDLVRGRLEIIGNGSNSYIQNTVSSNLENNIEKIEYSKDKELKHINPELVIIEIRNLMNIDISNNFRFKSNSNTNTKVVKENTKQKNKQKEELIDIPAHCTKIVKFSAPFLGTYLVNKKEIKPGLFLGSSLSNTKNNNYIFSSIINKCDTDQSIKPSELRHLIERIETSTEILTDQEIDVNYIANINRNQVSLDRMEKILILT